MSRTYSQYQGQDQGQGLTSLTLIGWFEPITAKLVSTNTISLHTARIKYLFTYLPTRMPVKERVE